MDSGSFGTFTDGSVTLYFHVMGEDHFHSFLRQNFALSITLWESNIAMDNPP